MRKHRSFDEVEEEYFRKHPEEVDAFLAVIFEEYAETDDIGALLSSLRTVIRVKGITAMADEVGMTRKGLQKALSDKGHPKFESVNAIMHAMGYRLAPQRVDIPQHVS